MRNLILVLMIATAASDPSMAHAANSELTPAQIERNEACVYKFVRSHFEIPAAKAEALDRGQIKIPTVLYSHKTSLKDFQDMTEKFWNLRPSSYQNYFNFNTNEIFLATEAALYPSPRTQLDVLAHEFTHFLQFLRHDFDLEARHLAEDQDETEAIQIQDLYREAQPCPIN